MNQENKVFPLTEWLFYMGSPGTLHFPVSIVLNYVSYKETENIIYLGTDGFLHLISHVRSKI